MSLPSVKPVDLGTATQKDVQVGKKGTDLRELLTFVRRHLHAHPEVGFQEHQTARFIRQVLESHDLKVHGPIAGTGLYVEIEGLQPGPTVAYRADIDALPIQDKKNVSYASTVEQVAHLCGHDGHTAIAIGVALLLQQRRDALHGNVRVFFQPNEEGHPSGSVQMIADGILDNVQCVFACHVDPTLPVGKFGLTSGAVTAASDAFNITVSGPGTAHAARPHQTADVVWIGTQILNALYQIVGRLNDARNTAVITFTQIHAGNTYNVMPSSIQVGGSLRCIDQEDREKIKQRIRKISVETSELYGATAEVTFIPGSPPVVNDAFLVDNVAKTIVALYGQQAIYRIPRPSMGSEDFAHYLQHVPGALVRIGTSDGPATSHPLHDSEFDIAESALPLAAELMTHVLTNQLQGKTNGRA